jgi:DNA-binding NarL/FixJ family response regulator
MPSLNGLDCTRQLRDAGFPGKILILTMHTDATMAREALDAGANGYVLKSSPASELRGALQEVLRGHTYLSPTVTREFVETAGRAESGRDDAWARLTPRQREVLQLLAEGKSHKEVAATLNISVKTAEYHKYAILETLGIKTNAELVQYAIRHHIIAL